MRSGVPLPLGAAMAVLASLLLLHGCWEVGAEIGGRHIRRITAADLPSTNSTEATKVRLKKTQVKGGENCTKEGSCMNAMTAAPHSNPKGKTTSSFLADDVLQGRLHADVLSFLTTTGSPYGRGYDSYFDGDIFESTTTASDEESTSNLTSPKSTKLRPVTRVRGALSQKRTQQSSMQENRLSAIQVVAPITEQDLASTTEGEVLATSTSLPVTTESKDLTIKSGAWYKQTETLFQIISTNTEISTSSDVERGHISYKPYFIPSLQVTVDTSMTADDSVTTSTESFGSTTEMPELTSVKDSTTAEGFHAGTLSVEDDTLLSTVTADEPVVTSTTGRWFQETRESGVGLGNYQGTSHDISNIREESKEGDGNKQGGSNTDEKLLEGDTALSENEDGTLMEGHISEDVYSQGNVSGSNSDDESKDTGDGLQLDNSQSSQKLSAVSGEGENPYLLHNESPYYGDSGAVAHDYTPEATTAEATDTPATNGTGTSASVGEVETFAPPGGEQVTTWGSSPSANEWDADTTTLPSVYNVPFYLVLSINASWPVFCDHLAEFKQSVVTLLINNDRYIESYQVILPNAESTRCPSTEASPVSPIEVDMYLASEGNKFDHQLTLDFYTFWRESGLPEFPIDINTVQPAGQISDGAPEGADEGGGMIAAITISCIGAACLLLLAALWVVMRKRQQRFNYGQRCTPVSLDAYSLDSVSVCGSVRRKTGARNSKRSYGNAGFDDPSAPSHPMGFAGLANFSLNRESVEQEFARIPQVTANVDDMPEGADTKNRYANVIPLPETRVQLSPREGEPLSEYINANFVHGPKNASKYYIACQAPMASTVIDFWRMIWEQQSRVILMLTDLVENGVEKSADYLPPSEVLDCHRLFGDFQITLKKREVKDHYIISSLQLKNLETNSWREVIHLWYVSWPIQGVPEDASSLIAFLLEARPYMRSGPCVVHCSPGTGRTGTVIACDLCIRDFETTRIVNIPRCVARLRRDRAGAVQTRDQYAFIYQVINLYGTKLTGGALDSM
ncbi:receptor-type tyrosine-protein phosphatase zeta isoform X2 [Cryptotermes secundus]|nr:receptor-type tyrosine-protein phosphatase zeta isoform X2 [Cryptotermes secundus]